MSVKKLDHKTDSTEAKESAVSQSSTIVEKIFTKVNTPIDNNNLGRMLSRMKAVMLPEILKKLMKDKNINMRSLSKGCGIPVSTLSTYLSAKKATYDPAHLFTLASFFSVTLEYLLFGNERTPLDLGSLPTESVFEGWLKVKIERAIPVKGKKDEEK